MTEVKSRVDIEYNVDPGDSIGKQKRRLEQLEQANEKASDSASKVARATGDQASASEALADELARKIAEEAKATAADREAEAQIEELRKAYAALERRIDPTVEASKRLAQAEKIVSEAAKAGIITKQAEERALEALRKKFDTTSAELREYQILLERIDPKTRAANERARAQKILNEALKAGKIDAREYGRALKLVEAELKASRKQAFSTADALRGLFAGFTLYQLFTVLNQTVESFAEVETATVGVQKTVGLTRDEAKRLRDEIFSLAKSALPVAIEQLLEIGQAAGQLGVQGSANIKAYIDAIARLAASSDLEGEEAALTLQRILNIRGEGPENVLALASAITALGNDAAASEREIAGVAIRVAGSTATFNITSAQIIGIATALKESGIRAELGGNAFGRALLEIQAAVSGGGEALEQFATVAQRTPEEFKKLWESDVLNAFGVFLEGLRGYGDNAGVVLDEIGLKGAELFQVLGPLSKNSEKFFQRIAQASAEAERTIANPQASAVYKESSEAFDTLSRDAVKFSNVLKSLAVQFGDEFSPALRQAASELATLLESVQVESLVQDLAELASITLGPTVELVRLLAENARELATVGALGGLSVLVLSLQKIAALGVALNPVVAGLLALSAVIVKINSGITDAVDQIQGEIDLMVEAGVKVRQVWEQAEAAIESASLSKVEGDLKRFNAELQISRDQAKGVEAEIQALEAANAKLTKTLDDQRKAASARPLNASSAVETGGTSARIGENHRKIEALKQQLQDLDNLSSGYEVNIARLQASLRNAALESSRSGDEIEEATEQAGRSLDAFLGRSAPSETPYDKARLTGS